MAQAAAWRRSGLELRMSVNLSASNLLDTSLPGRVAELLEAHRAPGAIMLEVTESVLLTDPDRSLAVVGALAELGVTVSIDDYGTGYSSLAYLRDLPVTRAEARPLVHRRPADRRPIARHRRQHHRAGAPARAARGRRRGGGGGDPASPRSLGCDISQGYLHAKPLPADQLRDWLTRSEALPALR